MLYSISAHNPAPSDTAIHMRVHTGEKTFVYKQCAPDDADILQHIPRSATCNRQPILSMDLDSVKGKYYTQILYSEILL